MGRFYVENSNNHSVVRYKADLFEKISKEDIAYFDKALLRGILKPVANGFKTIVYQVPDGMQLRQYIKKGLTKDEFCGIVLQSLEALKKINNSGLNVDNLRLETDTTFVNENTKEVYFAYLPAKEPSRKVNVGKFITDMAYSAVLTRDADSKFINDMVAYIGNKDFVTVKEIEEYICKPQGVIKFNLDEYSDDDGTVLLDDEATVFLDDEGTALLEDEPQTHIYIMRVKTCEETEITTPSFIIGKDDNKADLAITDNNAISRVHMELTCIEGRYFVRDNNSTNGTYVNEVRLEKGASTEIVDGDEIRLANEDFEFHVETTI